MTFQGSTYQYAEESGHSQPGHWDLPPRQVNTGHKRHSELHTPRVRLSCNELYLFGLHMLHTLTEALQRH